MEGLVVLRIYQNGELKEVKQFTDSQIVIGTNQGVQLELSGGGVSPLHAVIEKRDSGYFASDLGSQGGFFLNEEKVLDQQIKSGDKLTVGEYTIEFFIGVPKATQPEVKKQSVKVENKPAEPKVAAPVIKKDEVKKSSNESPPAAPSFEEHKEEKEQERAQSTAAFVPDFSKKTFAPPNLINADEIIKPGKGTTVEVLMVWQDRIISSHNFSEKGEIVIGVGSDCDIIVPDLDGKKSHKFVKLETQAEVSLLPGMSGEYISGSGSKVPFSELSTKGIMVSGTEGPVINLAQGDMLRVDCGSISLYVRYKTQAPKPLGAPFLNLTVSELTAVVIPIAVILIVALYAWIYSPQNIVDENLIEEQIRKATVTFKPPPRIKREKKPVVQKIVEKKKKVVKAQDKKKVKRQVKKIAVRKTPDPKKKSGKAKGARKNPKFAKNKKSGSARPGGAIKTGKKGGAGAKSAKPDPTKLGLLGTFGKGGRQKTLDQTFSGAGELAGTADRATGESGWATNRDGDDFGTKGVGVSGSGTSTKGIGGVGSGTGLGGPGKGLGGLGEKGSVSIEVGGGGEEDIGGYIDKDAIRRVIRKNKRSIKYCYDTQLNRNKNLYGKIVLRWQIHSGGRVEKARLVSNSLRDNGKVAKCIIARLRTWRFPEPPENTIGDVTFPFVFSAQ